MRNKKLYKRLVALILAGCVVVGSSAVGFAADTEEAAARLKHYHTWIRGTKISDATCISPGFTIILVDVVKPKRMNLVLKTLSITSIKKFAVQKMPPVQKKAIPVILIAMIAACSYT